MQRGRFINTSDIRRIVFSFTLERYEEIQIYRDKQVIVDDTFHSILILGPPGVGKSTLPFLAAGDVALYFSNVLKRKIDVSKINIRVSTSTAMEIVEKIIRGETIPFVHLYLPQTKLYNLEGTPSPMDNFVEVSGVKIPVNLWRIDAFLLPLLDYTKHIPSEKWLPAYFVLDEFNMAEQDVLRKLFQLARAGEIGRVKLNPGTIILLLGNTPETNISAIRYIADPLIDRAEVYYVSTIDVSGWISYMEEVYGDNYAREVATYLLLNEKEIYKQSTETPGVVQTPRCFTFLAVRLHVLNKLRKKGLIKEEDYVERRKDLVYSLFVKDTADKLLGFLEGVRAVDINEVLKKPEMIENMDKTVAGYCLLTITGQMLRKYKSAASEDEKQRILRTLSLLMKHGMKPLGAHAVSLVVSSLPTPLQIKLARETPPDVRAELGKIRKKAEEIEEAIEEKLVKQGT